MRLRFAEFLGDGAAWAAYTVTFEDVGPNVVATGSGSLDLGALAYIGGLHDYGYVEAKYAQEITGSTTVVGDDLDEYGQQVAGPADFGAGAHFVASSGSGQMVGIKAQVYGIILVPTGYVSGDPLSDTAVYPGESLDSLGLTPGHYVYSWGSGATADTFTVQIGSAVPEASTWAMMLAGFASLLFHARSFGSRRGHAFVCRKTVQMRDGCSRA